MAVRSHLLVSLSILLLHFHISSSMTDSEALLSLKKFFTNTSSLKSWEPLTSPCNEANPWVGLICNNGIITGIHLPEMGLSGDVDVASLVHIPGLRTLNLNSNSFSGPIPDFNRLGALKAIYLSGNQFSGQIQPDYFAEMSSLKKIWFSNNNFLGEIPSSLSNLSRLIELHLENNQFTGRIPSMDLSSLVTLNVSNNKLEGEIPSGLVKFGADSFSGNEGLCGEILDRICPRSPVISTDERNNRIAAAFMTLAVVIFSLMLVAIFMLKRRGEEFDLLPKETHDSVEVHVSGPGYKKDIESVQKNGKVSHHGKLGKPVDLVVINDEKGKFELADLMKSAAEVLGNGSLGSAYKAVMSDGVAVVVKRVKEMNRADMEGFEAEMRKLGALKHWNILSPLAYHYRHDEKLLVYEYIPKGNLLYLLHGDRGPTHGELDWPVRLKIVHGIARGMGYLLSEFGESDLIHGNLKSSNVLLSSDNEPLLTDYGFNPLLSSGQAAKALFAYKSPEAHQVSSKSDVYCLGIIILEILTGKFPSQYLSHGKGGTDVVEWARSAASDGREDEMLDPEISNSKPSVGEMVKLLQLGVACTESNPQLRLGLREAIQKIEEIHIVEVQ